MVIQLPPVRRRPIIWFRKTRRSEALERFKSRQLVSGKYGCGQFKKAGAEEAISSEQGTDKILTSPVITLNEMGMPVLRTISASRKGPSTVDLPRLRRGSSSDAANS